MNRNPRSASSEGEPDTQDTPSPRLRLAGSDGPPIEGRGDAHTGDPHVAAVCDLLIRSGVAAERIRVNSSANLCEKIAERALALWIRDGRPPDGALRCWQDAETLVVAEVEQG